MDRVAVFVDVQNVYYTVKQSHGCHFDYQAFWDQVTAGREVVGAFEVYGARKLTAATLIQAATRFVPIEGRLLLSN